MLPWAEMMNGALRLGLQPQAFWRLSLREWIWLTGEVGASIPHDSFINLQNKYPDRKGASHG